MQLPDISSRHSVVSFDVNNVKGYYIFMIKGYRDKETRKIAEGELSKHFPPEIQRKAKMRLDKINAAASLDFLRIPRRIGWKR